MSLFCSYSLYLCVLKVSFLKDQHNTFCELVWWKHLGLLRRGWKASADNEKELFGVFVRLKARFSPLVFA